ncbi:MAG: hypothetical protein JWO03_1269 [Bacteroidetes bacterium]|nr:hypothetical protein [Bacteroidota bacterium]
MAAYLEVAGADLALELQAVLIDLHDIYGHILTIHKLYEIAPRIGDVYLVDQSPGAFGYLSVHIARRHNYVLFFYHIVVFVLFPLGVRESAKFISDMSLYASSPSEIYQNHTGA